MQGIICQFVSIKEIKLTGKQKQVCILDMERAC